MLKHLGRRRRMRTRMRTSEEEDLAGNGGSVRVVCATRQDVRLRGIPNEDITAD